MPATEQSRGRRLSNLEGGYQIRVREVVADEEQRLGGGGGHSVGVGVAEVQSGGVAAAPSEIA
ncbi:hypothetical protein GCM10009529_02550 [Micropruina glycogenica]